MLIRALCLTACCVAFVPPAYAQRAAGGSMPAPVVFFDIAGTSSDTLTRFYSEVFGWQVGADGRFVVPVSAPLPAVVRQDPPEKRIYLGVPDVAATLKTIKAKGGTLDSERFEVPGVVVLGLFKDPEGNPMGLVELDGDKIKIP
jgi:uncharacterized protein